MKLATTLASVLVVAALCGSAQAETRSVPAPVRDIAAGEAIGTAALTAVEIEAQRAAGLAVSDAELAGMAARRPLRAGQPIRLADLQRIIAVKRGDVVTLVYEAPGITLTTTARAEAAGAVGDSITLTNSQSKRRVEGHIIAPGMVAVGPRIQRFATVQ